jgi:hypothetical protein
VIKGGNRGNYTESSAYATSGHTHTTTLATDSGTASVSLAPNTKYKLTAGGTNVIFKTLPFGVSDVPNIVEVN